MSELVYAREFKNPAINLAGCFAVKEAFFKAIGTGLSEGLSWKDVEVGHMENKKPFIMFRNEEAPAMVTISHTDTTAGAVVILLEAVVI